MQHCCGNMKTLVARRIVLLPGHSATPNKLKAQLSTTASIIGDPRVSCRYTDHYNRSKAFSDAHLKPEAKIWDESAVFPHSNYSKFAELGYGGIYAGKDVGGSQLSRSEGVVIYEALATGCVTLTAMLSIHNACVTTIDRFGSLEQRLEWLPELCTLETKASFCLTEPGSGSDAASLQTSAVLRDDHYHINGSKCFISGAGMSDLYIVMCRTGSTAGPESISAIVVPKDSAGLSFGANEKKMGWRCQPTRQVFFDNVIVPVGNRLGKEGYGFKIAMEGLDSGRLAIAACSLGAAQACLDIAVEELRKVGSIDQTAQWKIAEMTGKIISSRVLLRESATMLDAKHPASTSYCAIAKRHATDNGFDVCNDAQQLLKENEVHQSSEIDRYVRDCRVHQILEGTNEIMRHIIARSLIL